MEGESASYYDVLNLDRRASSAEVDQAFFKVDEAFRAIGAGWEGEAAAGTDGIREAYNVLSDQAQRNVYDVYGKRGLKAGKSVVPVRPMREQWLMYQQQRLPQDHYDLLIQSSDITVSCNATEAVSCVLRGVQPEVWPVITGVGVDSVMRLDHSDRVMGLVGCRMRLRNLFKPKKPLSGWLQVPIWVKIRASMRDFVSLGLCAGKHATASVSLMRILSATSRAEVTASAGYTAPSFHAQLVHSIGRHRLELHLQHNQTSHAAIAAEVGLSATAALRTRLSLFPGRVSLEVGIAHSGPLTSGYAGVAYGTLGTTVNVRLSRAGHSVHLPLHLSDHYQDWRTLLLAVTLPLAVNILSTQLIIKPVVSFAARAHAAEERRRLSEQIEEARKHALRQQAVMGARVARLAANDSAKTGFHVIKAVFGHLDGFREVLEEQACRCVTAGHDREAVVHALEHCDSSDEWLDATTSMHLLVLDGKIWIRQGRDKSELRGLADLHPGGTSHLYVLYLWKGQFYEAQVAGDEELRLPLRKATPLSGEMASLAQLLSSPAAPALPVDAAPQVEEPNSSSSGTVHDENRAPPNGFPSSGTPTVGSHTLKL